MTKRLLYTLGLIGSLFSCGDNAPEGVNKFADPVIKKIYDFKDRRLADSLYQFCSHENANYRQEAALAFASVQDSLIIENLGKWYTRERDSTVRRSLAFAIGQTKSQHAERILLGALMREKDREALRELLEAYGKATSHWQLIQPTYLDDTVKAEGLAWSIYRAGLRNVTDTAASSVALKLIDAKHHERTQFGAASYFARGGKNFESGFDVISSIALTEPSADLRMAAAFALGKINTDASRETLFKIIQQEKEQKVLVNAVRALQQFKFADTRTVLYSALYNQQTNVAIAASEVIKTVATKEDWIQLSNIIERVQNWRVQANLYEAMLSNTDNKVLVDEVKALYEKSFNPYQKAALLGAMKKNVSAYDFIESELLNADTAVIRSSAAQALADMNYEAKFNNSFKEKFIALCKKVMTQNDLAVTGILAGVLADSTRNYRATVQDYSFLTSAKQNLSLPKDNEALQPLEGAIAYFEKRKPRPVTNEFNNPLDWKFIETIKKNQKVLIKTSRGNLELQLFVEDAPGSVANFLKLAEQNYFDKKFFHRVVPNFVVQAGCNRGDGWGGENFSIRSEFSHRRYTTGSVGMASAGKDTEGTQWFITHSPTPHLGGRYTIFAEVTKGMEAVNQIEVGDKILDVEIVKD